MAQHLTDTDKACIRTLALFSPQGLRRRKGPSPAISLSSTEEAELVEFVTSSRTNRQLLWFKVSNLLFDGAYGEKAIRNALRRFSYRRYRARSKPPLTARRMALRKAFADEHRFWTPEQWASVLWSDETWVTWGLHRVPYITRLPDEEYDDNCDNAPGHAARATMADFRDRGIHVVEWPAYSLDLNLIETVWNWMKDYIQQRYGNIRDPSYDRMREWVIEAWEAILEDRLQQLLEGLSRRCQKVYDAGGGHIEH
ncbi:hypothetical protein CHU98_g7774 [Xylaria longipes]|nr:hypothetical protein CHU98_g7774 [Xylaria longipes]